MKPPREQQGSQEVNSGKLARNLRHKKRRFLAQLSDTLIAIWGNNLLTQTIDHNRGQILLTPAKLARRWSWHPESIRRWTRLGKLPVIKVGNRTLIPLSAIEKIEADGFIAAKSDV